MYTLVFYTSQQKSLAGRKGVNFLLKENMSIALIIATAPKYLRIICDCVSTYSSRSRYQRDVKITITKMATIEKPKTKVT